MENQPQVSSKKSRLAIASLILGIAFFVPFASILAIIFGIIALVKISKNKELAGKGMAISGLVLGGLGCVLGLIFLVSGYVDVVQEMDKTLKGEYTESMARAWASEATTNITLIRHWEEEYKKENGVYISCDPNPATVPSGKKESWNSSIPNWAALGFSPMTDEVYYQYYITVHEDGKDYTIKAVGDLNKDGVESVYTMDRMGPLNSTNPLE